MSARRRFFRGIASTLLVFVGLPLLVVLLYLAAVLLLPSPIATD